jgi:cellulose biosynthesis protein BcsQ
VLPQPSSTERSPLQTEFLATLSVDLMMNHVAILRRSDPTASLRITGILLTHADRTVMSRQVVAYTRDELTTGRAVDAPVFKAVIRRSVRFAEAQAMGKTLLEYDAHGDAAQAYRALAPEILDAAPREAFLPERSRGRTTGRADAGCRGSGSKPACPPTRDEPGSAH